jgi:hypothetical protein
LPISNITTGEQAFNAPAVQPQPALVSPFVRQQDGDGITRVKDSNGRMIGVKPLTAIDMFRLTKAMGEDASNAALFRQAMVAVAAVEIDGAQVARPASMMTIEALITRLDFAALSPCRPLFLERQPTSTRTP